MENIVCIDDTEIKSNIPPKSLAWHPQRQKVLGPQFCIWKWGEKMYTKPIAYST